MSIQVRQFCERFWKFVPYRPDGACWIWKGTKNNKGYGMFGSIAGNCGKVLAHRLMWMICYGDPGALHICHRCDVPSCVNPDHLFLGTRADNMNDCVAKGRHGGAMYTRNYCKKGHTPLKYRPSGKGWCPICSKDCSRKRWRKLHPNAPRRVAGLCHKGHPMRTTASGRRYCNVCDNLRRHCA